MVEKKPDWATNRTNTKFPRGGQGRPAVLKPTPVKTQKEPKESKPISSGMKKTLKGLGAAVVLGVAAVGVYSLLPDSNSEPQVAVQPATNVNHLPKFETKPVQMKEAQLKAYSDLRTKVGDMRMTTLQIGDNPLFLAIENEMSKNISSKLKSGKYTTTTHAIQQSLTEINQIVHQSLLTPLARHNGPNNSLPIDGGVRVNMEQIINQVLELELNGKTHKIVLLKDTTPQMVANAAVFFGNALSAMAISANTHLENHTPAEASKVVDLMGKKLLDPQMLAKSRAAQHNEGSDAEKKYTRTLQLAQAELKRGKSALDAVTFAVNQYKTSKTNLVQQYDTSPKTDSFVERYVHINNLIHNHSRAEQINLLEKEQDNPTIIKAEKSDSGIPFSYYVVGGLCILGAAGAAYGYSSYKEQDAAKIKPTSQHDNKVVRQYRDGRSGI